MSTQTAAGQEILNITSTLWDFVQRQSRPSTKNPKGLPFWEFKVGKQDQPTTIRTFDEKFKDVVRNNTYTFSYINEPGQYKDPKTGKMQDTVYKKLVAMDEVPQLPLSQAAGGAGTPPAAATKTASSPATTTQA